MEKILKGSMEENILETKEKSNSVDQSSSSKAAEKNHLAACPSPNRGSREKVRDNGGTLPPGLKHDPCRGTAAAGVHSVPRAASSPVARNELCYTGIPQTGSLFTQTGSDRHVLCAGLRILFN